MSVLHNGLWLTVLIWGCSSSANDSTSSNGGTAAAAGTLSTSSAAGGARLGSGGNSAVGSSCNGQEALCPGIAYGLCNEVQMSLGHCVDWSKVGATVCVSPADCPATQPTPHFATNAAPAIAICVKANTVEYSTNGNSSDPGYCAAIQSTTDATGLADCSTNPCGISSTSLGFCSYIRNKLGTSVVSCTWPI